MRQTRASRQLRIDFCRVMSKHIGEIETRMSSARCRLMAIIRAGMSRGSEGGATYTTRTIATRTPTQADIDLGIVNIPVEFAPLRPAEFVVIRLEKAR